MVTKEEMKALLEEVFEERSRIDAATHGRHHVWIEEQIEICKAKKSMYWKIGTAVAQYSVLGLLGGLWYWIQHGHWPTGG